MVSPAGFCSVNGADVMVGTLDAGTFSGNVSVRDDWRTPLRIILQRERDVAHHVARDLAGQCGGRRPIDRRASRDLHAPVEWRIQPRLPMEYDSLCVSPLPAVPTVTVDCTPMVN